MVKATEMNPRCRRDDEVEDPDILVVGRAEPAGEETPRVLVPVGLCRRVCHVRLLSVATFSPRGPIAA